MADDILYDKAGPVATITMSRPKRRNALTLGTIDRLGEALRAADADHDLRCLILTGAGDAFSAGLDFTEAAKDMDLLDSAAFRFEPSKSPAVIMQQMDLPVVAAVNGPAAGYAVGMAINADIRVMARTARLVPPTKRNLLPESGDTYLLPRLVGWEQAARFYFLGEDMTGDQALAAGVVSEVAEDSDATKDRAAELAGKIAAMPPLAIRSAKRMMRAGRTDAYEDHVWRALLQLLPMFKTKDFSEAISAFFEKRDPDFTGE